jgi:hypothetical protein
MQNISSKSTRVRIYYFLLTVEYCNDKNKLPVTTQLKSSKSTSLARRIIVAGTRSVVRTVTVLNLFYNHFWRQMVSQDATNTVKGMTQA